MTTTDIHIALQLLATRVEHLEAAIARMTAASAAPAPAPAFAAATTAHAEVADDYDLDSPYGDPEVRRDPPRWKGEAMTGRRYSQTSAAFLECIAGFLDWAASQADAKGEMTTGGKPRAPYLRRDAARARGWRARMLAGEQAAQAAPRVETRTSSVAARERRAAAPAMPRSVAAVAAQDDDQMPF